MKASIMEEENKYDMNNEDEELYYYQYLKYFDELTMSRENLKSNKTHITKYQDDLNSMRLLLESIEKGENKFTDEKNLYYLKYKEYNLKIEELESNFGQNEMKYISNENLYEQGAISKFQYEEIKSVFEKSKRDFEQYTNSYVATLKKDIEQVEIKLNDLLSENKKMTPTNINLPYETQVLIEINNTIDTLESEIRTLKKNLDDTEFNIQQSIVSAEIDGKINIKNKINVGDFISGGLNVATIIPEESSIFKIEISMLDKDISKVKIGDRIKYRFHALPHKEYGELYGEVTNISVDSTIDENLGTNYFIIEGNIDNKPLYSYKGKESNVKVGLTCEVHVVTESKKILFYLLEKIDLWDK